eukprot:337624-Pleurochrysis_carterae.AAC.1
MMRAVARGYVAEDSAHFVCRGLLRGFDLAIDVSRLRGKMHFRNHRSTLSNRAAVSKALRRRLRSGQTLCLETYERGDSHLFDHTRSGVNAATELGELTHSITSYDDVIRFLERVCNVRVSDVDGAFPLLPLAPEVWPLFHWWDLEDRDNADSAACKLYMHVCADFGAAGAPGTWNRFFVEVLLGIAGSENVLTLPTAVHVDDMGLICARSSGWPASTMCVVRTPLGENGVVHQSCPSGKLSVH